MRDRTTKRKIIRDAKKMFSKYMQPGGPEHAACLYWMVFVCAAAHMRGIRLVPQAGSAFWQRRPMHGLEDVENTHFGYEWDSTHPDVIRATEGVLGEAETESGFEYVMPEMHCWSANPLTGEVVDMTVQYLPKQTLECSGLSWDMPNPPSFLWGDKPYVDRVMPGAAYLPDEHATMLATMWLKKAMDTGQLAPLKRRLTGKL